MCHTLGMTSMFVILECSEGYSVTGYERLQIAHDISVFALKFKLYTLHHSNFTSSLNVLIVAICPSSTIPKP